MSHSPTPNPVPEEIELPDLSTYAGYAKAVHDFAVSLAERTADMDKLVAEYSMTPLMKAGTTAMLIESFVNTVVQIRLKVYQHDDRQATIKEVVERLKRESFDTLYQPSISDIELDEHQGNEKPVVYLDQANAQWRAALKKIEREM